MHQNVPYNSFRETTYSESAPAPYLTVVCERKRSRVARCQLDEDSVFRELVGVDSRGCALSRVEPSIITTVVAIIAPVVVDILQPTFPGRVTSQRALIVDTPGKDFVVVSERSNVHTTCSDLNNTNSVCRQVCIETRPLYVNSVLRGTQSKLAR